MIELNIPGRKLIQIKHLVCDVNGTLAVDGELHDGIPRILASLRDRVDVHILTADTHGRQHIIDQQLDLEAVRVKRGHEAQQKAEYVKQLGAECVTAIGQGANDAGMLKTAAIGIGILSVEGVAVETLTCADIIVPDIYAALELLEKPVRMVASLRK
ncbi:MAG: ATPase P [Chloroflexota bacterium]|nr:ATPase P [Chloroflexota bacterium]